MAQRVSWDLAAHAGKRGVIEVIDELALDAYAWIAVARVDPAVVVVPKLDPEVVERRSIAAAQLAETLGLRAWSRPCGGSSSTSSPSPRFAPPPHARSSRFIPTRGGPRSSGSWPIPSFRADWREAILTDAASTGRPASKDLVGKVAKDLPARLQAGLAEALAETSEGAELLLTLIEVGSLAASHLQAAAIQAKLKSHGEGGSPAG